MMRPWNTPWASSSSTVLNTSRLWQSRAMWLATSVVSACWRPLIRVAPRMPATVSSPSNFRNSWLRTTAPPMVKVKALKRALRADRGGERRDVQRVGALADDLDVIDMGARRRRTVRARH